MKFVIFSQSIMSCWNNGNAHFLRGVTRELVRSGHAVTVFEPRDGWSRLNAMRDADATALDKDAVPRGVATETYCLDELDLDHALDGADVVIAHEWNDPALISRLGSIRIQGGRFTLLFHDTHHRAVTAPRELEQFDLEGFDGVLAFGEVLREVYIRRGWGRSVFTWHEAADVALFHPYPAVHKDADVVWIGNWGDEERTEELEQFLISPVERLELRMRVYGVRYPAEACQRLAQANIQYAGWLPNHRAPREFARARTTIHVPRRPYATRLSGIPTIRVFEALACGIPLISAPWDDTEHLFPPGCFVLAKSGDAVASALKLILEDAAFGEELTRVGLNAILSRHTCAHRVAQLLDIVTTLQRPGGQSVAWKPSLLAGVTA
jgi:spore maturation protein CgeB